MSGAQPHAQRRDSSSPEARKKFTHVDLPRTELLGNGPGFQRLIAEAGHRPQPGVPAGQLHRAAAGIDDFHECHAEHLCLSWMVIHTRSLRPAAFFVHRTGHADKESAFGFPDKPPPKVPYTAGMARPSLSQLRVFVCVAEQGSFSGAAAELGMSQSSLSESVRSLEKALDVSLFQRQPQGIRLTDAGETVLEHAHRTVQAADDLERSLTGDQLRGKLRLAAYRSMGTYILPPVLARFQQLHPEVRAGVIVVGSDTQAQQLILRGEVDAVLGALPLAGPLLSWPLLHDPYVVLAPAGRGPKPFALAELEHTPLLLPPQGDSCCVRVLKYLESQQVNLHSVQYINEDSVVLGMVQHGLGVGITAVLAAQPMLPGVQVLSLPTPLERTLGLSVLATRASLPLLRSFVEVARETTNRTFTLPAGQLYPAV